MTVSMESDAAASPANSCHATVVRRQRASTPRAVSSVGDGLDRERAQLRKTEGDPQGHVQKEQRLPDNSQEVSRKEEPRPKEQSFWKQEVFSALTMVLPSIYVAHAGPQLAASARVSSSIWLMAYATYCHCVASMGYHFQCAHHSGRSTNFDHFTSPFRIADMSLIHLCCFTYGWAISGGWDSGWWMLFNAISFTANLLCVTSLIGKHLCKVPGSKVDSYRAIGCILWYSSAMVWRADWANYGGLIFSYGVGGFFWTRNDRMGKWGHGLFHVALVPCTYFVLQSAIAF
eukprot:gb/GFBE01082820.1/.p1 GENE.gb/GFBE01082820.1/~~gb/GFBE01082820.1/.p1  ORF type:complete len:288 (+),score=24.46 gb/GFBE01082820.1/:1-864(+)